MGESVPPFHCWDDFNSTLSISPSPPDGILFEFNCLSGIARNGSSWMEYRVVSEQDPFNEFTFVMGGMLLISTLIFLNSPIGYAPPTELSLTMDEVIIVKDVYIDCIRIGGNTVFDSFVITPDLPQDLAFDVHRNCIGGVYKANNIGKLEYALTGSNPFGSITKTIRLYYTRRSHLILSFHSLDTLQKGLRGHFYEVNNTFHLLHSPPPLSSLSSLSSSSYHIRKVSILSSLNNTSLNLESLFYSMDLLSSVHLYAIFDGLLSISSPGYYSFRFIFDSSEEQVSIVI